MNFLYNYNNNHNENRMSENWKTCKLEDIVSILGDGLHGTPKYTENGEYYFINGNNLSDGKIVLKSDTKRVNHDEYLKYKKNLNDRTLFVSINGTIGNVAFYNNENVILGKSACYFNLKNDVEKGFVKQLVSSDYFKNYIETNSTGSVIKNVSLKSMREFSFKLPPLPEQRSIASILTAIDDKIELNLQMNKTLEEMAMTLYKHWFVDFGPFKDGEFVDSELGRIPKGWEVKRLGEFVELIMGQSPKSEFYNVNNEGLPFHQGVSDYGIRFPKDITYSTSGNREANEGDILFSVRAPVGRLNIAKNKIILGRGLASMSMKGNNAFLFYSLKRMFTIENIIGSGTVFNSVNKTDLLNLEFIVPDSAVLCSFKQIVEPMDKQYFSNYLEIESLTSLRDTLLPKLISGEVRVKEAEKILEETL